MNISEARGVPKGGVIVNSHGLNLLTKKGIFGHDFFARGNGRLNKFDRELQAETKDYREKLMNTLFRFLLKIRLRFCLNISCTF
jgi:hypothetical protein